MIDRNRGCLRIRQSFIEAAVEEKDLPIERLAPSLTFPTEVGEGEENGRDQIG